MNEHALPLSWRQFRKLDRTLRDCVESLLMAGAGEEAWKLLGEAILKRAPGAPPGEATAAGLCIVSDRFEFKRGRPTTNSVVAEALRQSGSLHEPAGWKSSPREVRNALLEACRRGTPASATSSLWSNGFQTSITMDGAGAAAAAAAAEGLEASDSLDPDEGGSWSDDDSDIESVADAWAMDMATGNPLVDEGLGHSNMIPSAESWSVDENSGPDASSQDRRGNRLTSSELGCSIRLGTSADRDRFATELQRRMGLLKSVWLEGASNRGGSALAPSHLEVKRGRSSGRTD